MAIRLFCEVFECTDWLSSSKFNGVFEGVAVPGMLYKLLLLLLLLLLFCDPLGE